MSGVQSNLLGTAQPNLIGGIQPNLFAGTPVAQQPIMFTPAPVAPTLVSPSPVNNNANDLLGGFSSLSIHSQQSFAPSVGNMSGSHSLLDGFESGELYFILILI